MNPLPRPLPPLLLCAGAAAVVVTVPVVATHGGAAKELPCIAGTAIFLAMAMVVWRRHPGLVMAGWFAVAAGVVGLVQVTDGLVFRLAPSSDPAVVAWLVLGYHLLMVVASIALAHLLGLFPDHRIERPYERRIVTGLW